MILGDIFNENSSIIKESYDAGVTNYKKPGKFASILSAL